MSATWVSRKPGRSREHQLDSGGSGDFVVGAEVAGGMGAPEIVPFSDHERAQDFIAQYGGEAMRLPDIPNEAALGAVDLDQPLETPS